MKKRIAFLIVLMMVLCLALTGCGQNTNRTDEGIGNKVEDGVGAGDDTGRSESPGEDFDTGDSVIMDGLNNPNGTTSDSNLSKVDNKNPQQDANGMWIFEVRGHEVKLHTNVWDYIGTDDTANFFRLTSLARSLGYTERYNYDGLHMNKRSDGSLVFVGFQEHDFGASTEIMVGTEKGIWSSVRYQSYDASKMEYVYENGEFPVSFEFIVLCTYALEYNQDGAHDDTFSTILEDYSGADPGYVLPGPE